MKIWIGAAILGLAYGAWSVAPAAASDSGWRQGYQRHHGDHEGRRHHRPRRHHEYRSRVYESHVGGCRYVHSETWHGTEEVLACGQVGHDYGPPPWVTIGRSLEHAPSHETVAWQDPDNGIAYQVTPQPGYRSGNGAYCREYQTVTTIGGRAESAYGTACRQPDGSWKLVN